MQGDGFLVVPSSFPNPVAEFPNSVAELTWVTQPCRALQEDVAGRRLGLGFEEVHASAAPPPLGTLPK